MNRNIILLGALAALVAPAGVAVAASVAQSLELEEIDVASFDGLTGDRIHVRGFADGTVEQKPYTTYGGFGDWTRIPGTVEGGLGDLAGVAVAALDGYLGARLFVRGFEGGAVEQNFYLPMIGYTGWKLIPGFGALVEGDDLESISVVVYDGFYGPRVFTAAFDDGSVFQNIYTPGHGYTGWELLPKDGIDVPPGDELASIASDALDGFAGGRIFVKAFETGEIVQNIYTPEHGYTGWRDVPKPDFAESSTVESVDVKSLGDGARIFLVGYHDGLVVQNVYTPAGGFTGWFEVPGGAPEGAGDLQSVVAVPLDGLLGDRVLYRGFELGRVEQNVYTPGSGYSGWVLLP